jgi:hypoxanthine phosphoribosyltransferase
MSEFYPTSSEDTEEYINYGAGMKKRYSYNQIHQLVARGSHVLRESGFVPDYILAIGGGGLIPARMLRSHLEMKSSNDVPILVMTVKTYEKNAHTPNEKVEIIQSVDTRLLEGKKVLIVDEVDDTRKTLAAVLRELEYSSIKPSSSISLGIFVVNNKKRDKEIKFNNDIPYIVCEETDGNTWIEYPWDL